MKATYRSLRRIQLGHCQVCGEMSMCGVYDRRNKKFLFCGKCAGVVKEEQEAEQDGDNSEPTQAREAMASLSQDV